MNAGLKFNFSFWFHWILLNAVGWAMGMTIRQFLFGIQGFATNLFLIGVVIGGVVGVAQLFAFSQEGNQGVMWVVANVVGWAIGWGFGWSLGWDLMGSQGFRGVFGTIGALGGLVSGAIQWATLRQQFYQAGWWIPVSAAGWAAGLAVSGIVGGAFGWALAGATSGVITGLVLMWLLQHPVSERQES